MLLLIALVSVGLTLAHREPCKLQCDTRYQNNSLEQSAPLLLVCHRGCDLYTVALISTTRATKLPTTILSETNSKEDAANALKKSAPFTSKTTVEPTSQPVQELPEHVNSLTTTPNDPTKERHLGLQPIVARVSIQNSINFPFTQTQIKVENVQETIDEPIANQTTVPNKQDFRERIEQAKNSCSHACSVAYRMDEDERACVLGCYFQGKTSQKSISSEAQKTSASKVEHTVMNVAGHVGNFVRISWSWAVNDPGDDDPARADNQDAAIPPLWRMHPQSVFPNQRAVNPVWPVHKQVRGSYFKPDMLQLLRTMKTDFRPNPIIVEDSPQEDTLIAVFGNGQPSHFETVPVHQKPNQHHKSAIKEWNTLKNRAKLIEKKEQLYSQSHPDILECISRKSGLPRWFIGVTLFSCVPIVLWLCVSLNASPPEATVAKNRAQEADFCSEDEIEDDDFGSMKAKLLKQEMSNLQIV